MKYVVTADRYRRVTKEKDGTKVRTRYMRGDVVDLPESEADRLVEQGGLVKESEYDGPSSEPTVENTGYDAPETPGALSGSTAAEGQEGSVESQSDATLEEAGEDLDSLDYSALQARAKNETGNGSGSKSDLVARLREHRSA